MRYITCIAIVFLTCVRLNAQDVSILPIIEGRTLIANGSNGGPATVTEDRLGVCIANIGDLNNDGVDDLAVGAHLDDNGGASSDDYGAVYICFMTTSKTVSSYVKIGKATSGIGSDISTVDRFGISIAGLGDFNGDGYEDIVVGASQTDITSFTNSGAIYVILLNNSAGIVAYTKITRGTNGGPTSIKANSEFGRSVANIGDINSDGVTDIAVGGGQHDGGAGNSTGAVWTLRMNSNRTVASDNIITNGTSGLGTLDNSDIFGTGLCSAGDLNGDNIQDILIGAPGDDDYVANNGCFYLVYLTNTGLVSSSKKYTQPLVNKINCYTASSSFGASLFCDDMNGDGQVEFLIGNQGEGAFFMASVDASENIINIIKYDDNVHSAYSFSGQGMGLGICSLGDVDGDDKTELVIGVNTYDANSHTNNGGFYVLDMASTSLDWNIGDVLDYDRYGELSNSIATLANSDQFGAAVCEVGDVDGDGYNDIAIGAQADDDGGANRGAVYIVMLDSMQRKKSVQKISSGSGSFGTGLDDGDTFGASVCGPGDLDGDTIPDLLVGAINDDDGGTDRGCVWVVYLNSTGTVKSKSKISSTSGGFGGTLSNSCSFGISLAAPGDINKDGVNDIVVGANQDDDGGTDRGAVWVCFLNSSETVTGQQKISDTQGNFTATFSGNTVHFGISVDGAGDLNGDTKKDIIVGSHLMDGEGAAYILYLDTLGQVSSYKKIGNENGNFPYTLASPKQFGVAVKMMDDLDGDGNREVAIAQNLHTSLGTDKGAIWICFPDSLGNILDARLISEDSSKFCGNLETDDRFGRSLCTYRDDDSVQHVFIGAHLAQESGTDEGSVFRLKLASLSDVTSKSSKQHPYVELEKKLDGESYRVYDNRIRFRYYDKYHDSDDKLTFTIYNDAGDVVHNDVALTLNPSYGENRFVIDCGPSGAGLPIGNYILEVVNTKKEKYYLRVELLKV